MTDIDINDELCKTNPVTKYLIERDDEGDNGGDTSDYVTHDELETRLDTSTNFKAIDPTLSVPDAVPLDEALYNLNEKIGDGGGGGGSNINNALARIDIEVKGRIPQANTVELQIDLGSYYPECNRFMVTLNHSEDSPASCSRINIITDNLLYGLFELYIVVPEGYLPNPADQATVYLSINETSSVPIILYHPTSIYSVPFFYLNGISEVAFYATYATYSKDAYPEMQKYFFITELLATQDTTDDMVGMRQGNQNNTVDPLYSKTSKNPRPLILGLDTPITDYNTTDGMEFFLYGAETEDAVTTVKFDFISQIKKKLTSNYKPWTIYDLINNRRRVFGTTILITNSPGNDYYYLSGLQSLKDNINLLDSRPPEWGLYSLEMSFDLADAFPSSQGDSSTDTSNFVTESELETKLDTEYVESDPYPLLLMEGEEKSDNPNKIMLNVQLKAMIDKIFQNKLDNDALAERVADLEKNGGGSNGSGYGVATLVLDGVMDLIIPITEDAYDNNKDFIIDEGGQASFDRSGFFQIVIPSQMTKASMKILRFRRLHGVTMEYTGVPGLLTTGLNIKSANSCRINIAYENGDGSLTEIQDIVYKSEYIDIKVSYDDEGSRIECILLTELPLLQIQTSLAGVCNTTFDETTKDAYTELKLGVPCSEMLTYNEATLAWEWANIHLVSLGIVDITNPFYRSIKNIPDDKWVQLVFPVQGGTAITTDYEISSDINYPFIMRDTDLNLYTVPLGNHFPRFKQTWDWTWDDYENLIGRRLNPDTTAEHTHTAGTPSSFSGDTTTAVANAYTITGDTSINKGNVSYETAGRWIGVQGWIYL